VNGGVWLTKQGELDEAALAPFDRALAHAKGVYRRADDASARRYLRAVQSALERNRLAWALYDYHTGCAVRDERGQPTRVLEALDLARRRP